MDQSCIITCTFPNHWEKMLIYPVNKITRDILLENKNVKDKHVRVPENSWQGQEMP